MKLEINDIYGTKVNANISRSGFIRIDIENKDWPEYKHTSTGAIIPYCISLSEEKARLFYAFLKCLIEEND